MTDHSKTIELKISDVVYRGKGLARVDGQVVFVPGVVTGETVRVRIEKKFKNYSEASLLEVCEASPLRLSHACPRSLRPEVGSSHSMYCAGCTYQHMAYSEEFRLKQAQFANFMERMAGVDKAVIISAIPSPSETGYRNKIVLHGGGTPEKPVLGYVAHDNKSVIDVPMCLLAQKEINELLVAVRKDRALMSSHTQGRRLTLRHTPADGSVFWSGRSAEGDAWLTEASGVGDLLVPRDSFAQINTGVAHSLVRQVVDLLKSSAPAAVIDLYCGAGLFSFAAAEAGVARIFGVDNDPSAVRAAQRNANVRNLSGCAFLARSADAGLREVLHSVNAQETTAIVDPSRRGLEKGVVELLGAARLRRIIYVSCAPDTMARDVAHLCRAGYHVTSAQLLDMFPRTAHFESVTCLETGTK
ncbi:MAG: 50S ribosomal protein L11 methyltransferase [bacterium]